jgi:hypothetical protein
MSVRAISQIGRRPLDRRARDYGACSMFRSPLIIAVAVRIRKLYDVAIRGASFLDGARFQRENRPPKRAASATRLISRDTGKVAVIVACICLGLVSVGVVVVASLLVQIRGLKADMAQSRYELAATKLRLTQRENISSQTEAEAAVNRTTATMKQIQSSIVLSPTDIQIIRQSIKVTPPQTGAASKIAVGDQIPELASRPIPESLVAALPKLQGARFSIDAAAIVIIGAATKRVDAVIAYR